MNIDERIKIKDTILDIKVADTPEKQEKGLRGVSAKSMPKKAGLYFPLDGYEDKETVTINTVGMLFPIKIIYLKNDVIQDIILATPGKEAIEYTQGADAFLEVKADLNTDDFIGEEIEHLGAKNKNGTISTNVENINSSCVLLDDKGNPQKELNCTEIVFSRAHTKRLIELAKTAFYSENAKDYKKLGAFIMKVLEKQRTQEVEYANN